MSGFVSVPEGHIDWRSVTKRMRVRLGGSKGWVYVVTLPSGVRKVAIWGGYDATTAQLHLNALVRATENYDRRHPGPREDPRRRGARRDPGKKTYVQGSWWDRKTGTLKHGLGTWVRRPDGQVDYFAPKGTSTAWSFRRATRRDPKLTHAERNERARKRANRRLTTKLRRERGRGWWRESDFERLNKTRFR